MCLSLLQSFASDWLTAALKEALRLGSMSPTLRRLPGCSGTTASHSEFLNKPVHICNKSSWNSDNYCIDPEPQFRELYILGNIDFSVQEWNIFTLIWKIFISANF